jgi:hypothetical protein
MGLGFVFFFFIIFLPFLLSPFSSFYFKYDHHGSYNMCVYIYILIKHGFLAYELTNFTPIFLFWKYFLKMRKKKLCSKIFTYHNFFGPWVNKILRTPCTTLNMMMQLTKRSGFSSLYQRVEWAMMGSFASFLQESSEEVVWSKTIL